MRINGRLVEEHYECREPDMVVGNLVMGERYVEPQGMGTVTCRQNGNSAEVKFKARGWTTKTDDLMTVKAVVRDAMNRERYVITGSYVGDLVAKDMRTGHEWTMFRAPDRPVNFK